MARAGRRGTLAQPPRQRGPLILPGISWGNRPSTRSFAAGWTLCALLSGTYPRPLDAQDSTGPFRFTSAPSRLIEGTIGWLRVQPEPGATLTGGEAGGEPLHFERSENGEYRALVAVPVQAGHSLKTSIFVLTGGRTDTISSALPVRQGGYPRELLSVAPAFARPDSATAARIRADIARSREVSLQSQERPRLWRGPFRMPRTSRITSPFGATRVFNREVTSRHMGTDFAGAVGAPVHAAGGGVVALVADFYLAGRAVYLDHGGGLVTAYFHLSRSDVQAGDTVVAGQRIGAVGRSGRVTGPHLHWIARYGSISVDPMSLLALEKTGDLTPHSERLRGPGKHRLAAPGMRRRRLRRLSQPLL